MYIYIYISTWIRIYYLQYVYIRIYILIYVYIYIDRSISQQDQQINMKNASFQIGADWQYRSAQDQDESSNMKNYWK